MPDARTARSPTHNALTRAEPTLPFDWYHDPVHHRREMTAIWHDNWIYVCRADTLKALDYRTITIGTQNIVVLRDADGRLGAFHNACRHRGSIICTEAQGTLSAPLLVCPYHQWSYAPGDGRLVKTTSFAEPEGFNKANHGLLPVALAEWRGSVLIHLDPAATFDPAAAFQRPPDSLVNVPLEEMVVGHTWHSEIACNWKIFWENFNECLHCPNVHPELVDLVPLFQRRIIHPRDVPDWAEHEGSEDPAFRGGMKPGAETWSADHSAQGHILPTLTEEDLARGHTYASIWPSAFFAGYPDHARIVRLLPLGPERMEIRAEWLFRSETQDDPAYDLSNVVDFAVRVMDQDARACELNQQGLHAAPLAHGVLMPEEYLLKRFHDWVRAGLV